MIIKLTREDILQTKLVDGADWYCCKVTDFKPEASKGDGSTNLVFSTKIMDGPMKDVPCRVSFSEKFMGPFALFASACGEEVDAEGGAFNSDGFMDKELYIFIEPKENPRDKKIYNTPMQFKSIAEYEAAFNA